ncbi:MAG: hypothetical protein WAT12_11740 [Candidatus Nitrotoga sp.]
MTTLFLGQYAPLLFRSSVAPHSTLPHSESGVFLRRDLRHRADYYAIQEDILTASVSEWRLHSIRGRTSQPDEYIHVLTRQ